MGYLKHKYTKEYFTNFDEMGHPKGFGVNGIDDFLYGEIRNQDKNILDKVNFEGKKILDLGFGRGEAIKYALEHKAKEVTGVDFSEAANEIARNFLSLHRLKAELSCEDILEFISRKSGRKQFDIVMLLDVVEHIPRQELNKILVKLPEILSSKAILLINTPIFKIDNDGYKDGIDPRSYEDTDDLEETKGMHINRYTKDSLINFMKNLGYGPVSGHYFIRDLVISVNLHDTIFAKLLALVLGYTFLFPNLLIPEEYEYAYSRKYETEPNLTRVKKIYRFFKWKVKALLVRTKVIKSDSEKHPPKNVSVFGGPLTGHKLWLSLKNDQFATDQALGVYKYFIFEWLVKNQKTTDMKVWDLCPHNGYTTLAYASIISGKGSVKVLEPFKEDLLKFKKNIHLNKNLTKRIKVVKRFSSFINRSYSKPSVIYLDFSRKEISLESIYKVIKINKPILFIEIRTVKQMYEINKILKAITYRNELLNESADECTLVAYSESMV